MEDPEELRDKAERYRRMALQFNDPRTINALNELAREYDAVAARLEQQDKPPAS
jgi:hypothetical protein